MKLSIVIPTLGRVQQIEELLGSLKEIEHYEHEILIIDQNFSQLLDSTVEKYSGIYNINHHKVDFRSLSKAKNLGIKLANGEYICFPDDDSVVLDGTVHTALDILDRNPNYQILFGKCVDRDGNDSVIKFYNKPSLLTLSNFEGKFIEATMFARTEILKSNCFDENLGIGSFFGAEEGYDLIYRLLKDKFTLFYSPKIKFYHAHPIIDYSSYNSLRRVFEYRKGYSYLCIKHRLFRKLFKRMLIVSCSIPYFLVRNNGKAKFYMVELLSLIIGILLTDRSKFKSV